MATFPIGKLNPQTSTTGGVTTAVAKLNFPGFQEILDFTSAGSESSVSVTVDGDTDKEYLIYIRNLDDADYITVRPNTASSDCGYQYILNNAGTISAGRSTSGDVGECDKLGELFMRLLTPTGFIKTAFADISRYASGTTMSIFWIFGTVYNSTANVTSLYFNISAGNFTAGTRIVVYARRSNT